MNRQLPIAVDPDAGWVRWFVPTDFEFEEAFYDETVARTLENGDVYETPLQELYDRAARSAASPTALLFHAGRCGSTLVANALGTGSPTVVFKEPVVLSQALLARDAGVRRDLVGALVTCLCAGAPERPTVIKWTSWHTLLADELVELFPCAASAFIYRHPLEITVSMLERPPAWVRELRAGMLPIELPSHAEPPEVCARTLAAFFERITELSGCALLDHAHLTVPAVERLATALGLPLVRGAAQLWSAYSKDNTGRTHYVPDGAAKRARADEKTRRVVQHIAGEYFGTLDARRVQALG